MKDFTDTPDPIGDELRVINGLPEPAVRREIRVAAGLSQARLARAIGVSRGCIGNWELGNRLVPRGPLLDKYVEALRRLKAEATVEEERHYSTAVYYGPRGRTGDITVEATERVAEACANCDNEPPAGFACRDCGADGGPR